MSNIQHLPVFFLIFVMQGLFFTFAYSSSKEYNSEIANKKEKQYRLHRMNVFYFLLAIFLIVLNVAVFLSVKI